MWSRNFPTCRMEQSIKRHMTKNSLLFTEWEDCVIIMHYCNADPQSRASRKVITAVASVRDSHNIFSVWKHVTFIRWEVDIACMKIIELSALYRNGWEWLFSLSMWLYVSLHSCSGGRISLLSMNDLLQRFLINHSLNCCLQKNIPICKIVFFTHLLTFVSF